MPQSSVDRVGDHQPAPSASPNAGLAQAAARRIAATIGDIVAVLSRDPRWQNMPLKDLHRNVLPSVALGQCAVAYADASGGVRRPIAVVSWALVSDVVAERLQSSTDVVLDKLAIEDWRSGHRPFVVIRAGHKPVCDEIVARIRSRAADACDDPAVTEKLSSGSANAASTS